ncbi:MAG: hypothetical protein ABIS01_06795 [Ferruginibacter sp.]
MSNKKMPTKITRAIVALSCLVAYLSCNTGSAPYDHNTWSQYGGGPDQSKYFDLGDTRVGAAIDPVPVFVSGRLVQDKLKAMKPSDAGNNKLLRLFSEDLAKTTQAEPTLYNYQIQISFDTEENRRKWVASEPHKIAWPAASGLAKEFKWRGYDVMGDDQR